jgi:hypothetical protein
MGQLFVKVKVAESVVPDSRMKTGFPRRSHAIALVMHG